MNITINKDHLVYKNDQGSYHVTPELLLEKGNNLEEYVIAEIKKKLNSTFKDKTINFDQARELGFCEYGIKDFCEMLDLDINGDHSLLEVKSKLTIDAFTEYTSECIKLFGKNVIENFGGAKNFLTENKTRNSLNLILRNYVKDVDLHRLACDFALNVIDSFENKYPGDKRPRNAIETKLKWLDGEASDAELKDALSAAFSAARSAASRAASSAASAAWSAANSAASGAASGAAWSAAWSAASCAELEYQIDKVLVVLNKD